MVRGSVVDICFDARLPPIRFLLRAGADGAIVMEVQAQRDACHVRAIALTPTQGLARGMLVQDTGDPLTAPVGKGILQRTLALVARLFGNVMRGAMILAILLSITPLFFPIAMTVLGLLTGMVQA